MQILFMLVMQIPFLLVLQAWCATTLTLLAEARRAHGGDKVFCAAVGANGVLFTGGDDKVSDFALSCRARGLMPYHPGSLPRRPSLAPCCAPRLSVTTAVALTLWP